jgi:hypothetical protein
MFSSDDMLSQHGKQIKIIDGYKLRFHKILKNYVWRWNCNNKHFKSYLKTDESGNTVINGKLGHKHEKYE